MENLLALCCVETEASRLFTAAQENDVELATAVLLRNPAKAWAQQWGGQTPWHLAARDGHAAVLSTMADVLSSCPPAALQGLGATRAEEQDKAALIARAVQQPDVKGLTPLHMACIRGHAQAADVLMQLGSNPFAMDSVGRTPLHYAASWGFADCINAVLGHHNGPAKPGWEIHWPNTETTPLVDVRNASGFTPLHYAVWVGRKEAIQALASYDADLKVTNVANDFEWIRVGTGNTPLHLAAFGGDLQVVKLLLAAYMQSLAAGAEVMAAARGQWGERHTDDVRHMRNRRGWMPYHIALHKGFQHLAELLHPDIPYSFLFSNDDLQTGNVRMFGPARLMVLAAKALQQKLVSELDAVAADVGSSADDAVPPLAAAAAVAGTAAAAAAASADEDSSAVPAVQRIASSVSAPAPGAVAAAAAAASRFVSPFAAKSQASWTQKSFSTGSAEGTSDAAAGEAAAAPQGPPTAEGPVSQLTDASSFGVPPHAAAADDGSSGGRGAAAAAAAPPAIQTECSFAHNPQGGARLNAVATAPPGLTLAGSFGGFAVAQQGGTGAGSTNSRGGQAAAVPPGSAAVSEASMSSSTAPGSASAVAGTPPGSVSMSGAGDSSSHHNLPPSVLLCSTTEQPLSAGGDSQVQWMPGGGAAAAAAGTAAGAGQPHGQHKFTPDGRHRRVQSSAAAAGAGASYRGGDDQMRAQQQQQQQNSKHHRTRSRMESLARLTSRREPLDMLPPSSVFLTASDHVDDAAHVRAGAMQQQQQQQQQENTSGSRRRSLPSSNPGASGARRISSVPGRIGGAAGSQGPGSTVTAAAPGTVSGGAGQGSAMAVPDNPLNVVLALRAEHIGENPERIRQQLLALKLASGARQFSNAVTAFNAGLAGGDASSTASSGTAASARLASFVAAAPRSFRASFSRHGAGGGGVGAAVAAAAAAAAAAAPGGGSSPAAPAAATAAPIAGSDSAGPFAAAAPEEQQQRAASGDASNHQQQQQQQPQQAMPSLSPSPSLYNTAAVSVMTQQPSQSLHRLLSGRVRPRRAASSASVALTSSLQGSVHDSAAAAALVGANSQASDAAAAVASGNNGSSRGAPSPLGPNVVAGGTPAGGGLPMLQAQLGAAHAAMITEECDDDDDGTCEICFDAAAAVALQNCGHTLCVGCCRELCKLHHFKPGLCPYCRQIICGFARATCTFIP